ncbi:hypothetical protein MBLNU459_g2832t1 [Dothideomycetes sp. NU459]
MTAEETRISTNPLDYIPPRNYVRLLFPLPLKPNVDERIVFDDLLEALHKTFVQEPWVSGKVFRQSPDTAGWRPGQLEIRYPPYLLDGPRPYQLRYQRLDTDLTYADLKDSGFPSGIFPEELLLDAPRFGDVDVAGADIFLAQANFVPGGLLLGMTAFHGATDAAGMLDIQKLWAENFRELHERDAGGLVAPSRFKPIDLDRTLPDRIWKRETDGRSSSSDLDNPWLRGLVGLDSDFPGEDITGARQRAAVADERVNGAPLPPRHPRIMQNKIMFLSGGDLAALHKECAKEPLSVGASPVSVSDAINALLWRGVLRARAAAAKARSSTIDDISVFELPVDVRNAFAPDFPQHYLGNCFLLNTARMPLSELISPSTSLGRIAQTIREGAARLTSEAVHDAYALLKSADLSRVQGRFVERPESADLLVSNIIFFPMSEINFGGRYFENDGIPPTLRVLHGPYAPYVRLGHVLPKYASHGGAEMSVNLFDDEFVHLEADEEFNRYMVSVEV